MQAAVSSTDPQNGQFFTFDVALNEWRKALNAFTEAKLANEEAEAEAQNETDGMKVDQAKAYVRNKTAATRRQMFLAENAERVAYHRMRHLRQGSSDGDFER